MLHCLALKITGRYVSHTAVKLLQYHLFGFYLIFNTISLLLLIEKRRAFSGSFGRMQDLWNI